ncbi:hypothetical protein M2L40_000703 [Staphylococcus pseudintermedius]|nr:hypothetical protein [Staphylococcus pseudintermedius]
MNKLIAWFMTFIVAFITLTFSVFAGVHFTTLIIVVFMSEIATYHATMYVLEALKKTEC